MQNHPPNHQQPYPHGSPQNFPQPSPSNAKGNVKNVIVLLVIIAFVGGGVAFCAMKVRQNREEAQERERVAREEADTAILASIQKAKTLHGEGKLEEAVRELEAATGQTAGSNELRLEAQRLLGEYGQEYGKQFEGKVADAINEATDALRAGDADKAEELLTKALEHRYAPNIDEASKLLATLREARSETKMKSFVAAMSDAEFTAFKNDGTVPNRPVFDHPEIDSIFKTALRANQDEAQAWRTEALEAAAAHREREESERIELMNLAVGASLDGKLVHDIYAKEGFRLVEDRLPITKSDSGGTLKKVQWNGYELHGARYELRTSNGLLVQRDEVIYFASSPKATSISSHHAKPVGLRQFVLPSNANKTVKYWAVAEPAMYLLLDKALLGKSDSYKQLLTSAEAAWKSDNAEKELEVDPFRCRVVVKTDALNGKTRFVEILPVGLDSSVFVGK